MKHIQKELSEDVYEEMFLLHVHMWEIPINVCEKISLSVDLIVLLDMLGYIIVYNKVRVLCAVFNAA